MKKYFLLVLSLVMFLSTCGTKETKVKVRETEAAKNYIETISGFSCIKASITDNNYLFIAIDAVGTNYDMLALQFLEEAKNEGVEGLRGCFIVNFSTSQFQDGTVVGKRIGKAFSFQLK